MSSNVFLLSCALLAILIANMPMVQALSCAIEPTPDCTDCTDPANETHYDCVPWDSTTGAYSVDTTTEKKHHGGHKGGWRGGRRGRRGSKPTFNFFF